MAFSWALPPTGNEVPSPVSRKMAHTHRLTHRHTHTEKQYRGAAVKKQQNPALNIYIKNGENWSSNHFFSVPDLYSQAFWIRIQNITDPDLQVLTKDDKITQNA